jgi:hypothetical protein
MKHKMNAGPGLIVALGAPSDDAGKMGLDTDAGARPDARGARALPGDVNMDTVPLDLLSMPDDQEQMQPPEVGDVVNYQVTGKVVAIEGDDAKVQRQSINGQELQDDNETNGDNVNPQNANATADDDESQSLRDDASNIGMLS